MKFSSVDQLLQASAVQIGLYLTIEQYSFGGFSLF